MRRILAVGNDRHSLNEIEQKLAHDETADKCTFFATPPNKALALLKGQEFDLVIISDSIDPAERAELILEVSMDVRCPVVLYSSMRESVQEDFVTRILRLLAS